MCDYWPTRPCPNRWSYFHTWCQYLRHKNKIRAHGENNENLLAGAWWVTLYSLGLLLLFSWDSHDERVLSFMSKLFLLQRQREQDMGVINDPLGQTYSLDIVGVDIVFAWNLFCFARVWKVGTDGRTDNTCGNSELWVGLVDQLSRTLLGNLGYHVSPSLKFTWLEI